MLEGFIEVTPILRPGVYALVRNGVVVYIGQAGKAMLARIEAHRSNWGRKRLPAWMPASLRGVLFDSVWVLPCNPDVLNRLEAAMIDLYKPRYNIKLKASTPVSTPFTITVGGVSVPFNAPPPRQRFERRI